MNILYGFDPRLCSGCGACAVACVDQNDLPLRRILPSDVPELAPLCRSSACQHCADAPCMAVCPKGVFWREDGLTLYDNSACVGCGACARVCPHKAISFHQRKMVKCDGCVERLRAGFAPPCVQTCPTGALTVTITP